MSAFPSPQSNAHNVEFAHGRRSNRAFIIEALVLLIFIAFSAALLIQMFAAAEMSSKDAHRLSMSTQMAADAAETFSASPAAGTTTVYYDSDGNQLPSNERAVWIVTTNTAAENQDAGVLYRADITVQSIHSTSSYNLDTEKYVSNSSGGAA